jgi:RNA polymerase sigma factor (sigma-70 family)
MSTAAFHNQDLVCSSRAESLLRKIADGDRLAVSACIDRYGALIWYLAKRYCTSASDAEDAVQEIFIEVWQKAGTFNPELASEETFLTMLARRRLIDRRRRQASRPNCQDFTDDLEMAVDVAPEHALELEDEAAKAAACMEKLSTLQRSVLTMNIWNAQSHASISQHLKLPLGTVKSFARRGLILLRDCMDRTASPKVEGRTL